MLFTQINTDDFQLAAQSLLDQFRVLIAKSPLPLSADRLVQIMALNMYSIEVGVQYLKQFLEAYFSFSFYIELNGILLSTGTGTYLKLFSSDVDPNTYIELDPDPGFWPKLDPDLGPDPDPGLYNQFRKKKIQNNFEEK